VRMRQPLGQPPTYELEFCVGWARGHQLDRGWLRFPPAVLREEHGAFVRTAQVPFELKLSVDYVPFPLTPGLGHPAPLSLPLTCGAPRSISPEKEDRIFRHRGLNGSGLNTALKRRKIYT